MRETEHPTQTLRKASPLKMKEIFLFYKEVAETREKMKDVLQEFIDKLQAKEERMLNSIDDPYWLPEMEVLW